MNYLKQLLGRVIDFYAGTAETFTKVAVTVTALTGTALVVAPALGAVAGNEPCQFIILFTLAVIVLAFLVVCLIRTISYFLEEL